jgi:hypothetical protein
MRLHEALIETTEKDRLIGHISRDSTEIEARENPVSKPVPIPTDKSERKRGRPKKGETPPPPEPTRLERRANMTLEQMLDDPPRARMQSGRQEQQQGIQAIADTYQVPYRRGRRADSDQLHPDFGLSLTLKAEPASSLR